MRKGFDWKRVCYICLDAGGDLVECKKDSCAKHFHLECNGWDADTFRKQGCGFHVCFTCARAAKPDTLFRCYTCPTAYCSYVCLEKANFLDCVPDFDMNGLCDECWQIVRLIEKKEPTVHAAGGLGPDFNDKETYECMFKAYWEDRKKSIPRLTPASLESLLEEREKVAAEDVDDQPIIKPREFDGWASEELRKFVRFMKRYREPKKPLSRLQVTKLVWSHIRSHKLQDPKKNHARISCDGRLHTLFGKDSVGQFQLFKHLQSHLARAEGGGERDEQPISADHGSAVGDDEILSRDPDLEGYLEVYQRLGHAQRRQAENNEEKSAGKMRFLCDILAEGGGERDEQPSADHGSAVGDDEILSKDPDLEGYLEVYQRWGHAQRRQAENNEDKSAGKMRFLSDILAE